jgi:acyl transferase domain-containing protein/NAD(P)H-dependent flavin oxidoreductase YrpB (nitropropane dioxygenase family)
MTSFIQFVFTPAGLGDVTLAISASRAGAVGVYNAELDHDPREILVRLDALARQARGEYGIKLDAIDAAVSARLPHFAARGLRWLILDRSLCTAHAPLTDALRQAGVRVLAEVHSHEPLPAADLARLDGVMVKGNEAGGFVGEDASFILLQKWLKQATVPLYLRGGLTPHVAAACHAVGVAGGVLESQLLLLDEVRLPDALRTVIGNLAGSETVAVGDGERGEYFRILVRPGHTAARALVAEGDGLGREDLRARVEGRLGWSDPTKGVLPIGQEVAFAAPWRKRYVHLGAVLAAVDHAVAHHAAAAARQPTVIEGGQLARTLGVRYPIVQGPMTRVSDTAEFALAVAEGGALPMVAFAMLKGAPLEALLERTDKLLGERPWGIGLLGFAPQELLDEQLAIAARFKPDYAIIAGGRPDQAVHLERAGVPTFLHVPASSLIGTFLTEGARRFIFEGRECGGHIGPLSSFVLWSSMVDRLIDELATGKVPAAEVQLLFAGGIHDALSSAMVQVLAAPLVELGVQVGVLMGSAYLFTKEIVESGAIVPQYQQEVLDCVHTVNLESGPGHASRCAYTPFAEGFFRQRQEMKRDGVPGDESRRVLDDLILGRLRIASKGSKRDGLNAPLQKLDAAQQREEGMYMLGQVVTLRDALTDIQALHTEVTQGAADLLERFADEPSVVAALPAAAPADIAIVGMSCVLPKSKDLREYWENILARVDAITEIPLHRWDWRLYFDADRTAKDKVYSKWGGFLDDLVFDPTQYGMPPKSIESVDPMQMMGLEVARRTLVDAGYGDREFDRENASVFIGASGGAGDFGLQYGLRSEMPRFNGQLPADVAERLPEWTEDSFAGILPNVVAGRIANRLNFGGVNVAVDAACASSLAAVYQGVAELVAGRSNFVIAGGVDTVQGPFGYLCFSKTQALSPRGRCSTFDAAGDGIAISEGIAMVAMKRLADAERDGDRIYAVIKGVGASSDGKAKGLTAPLPAGQLRAMRRAYQMAGFGPSTVGLFEAHGTGTVVGDTAELESTTRLMKEEGAAPRQAVIGSVKTNIGHTKASAGVAAMVKAALALHHRVLPPHRNLTVPNRVLADADAPLYLLDEAMPWIAREDRPRRAACSAFGFGGTNFHAVMEEYAGEYREWLRPPASDVWTAELLVWSEADRGALLGRVQALSARLEGLDALALRDLAASLTARWRRRGETLAIVAKGIDDLRAKLAAAASFLDGKAGSLPPGVFHGTATQAAGKVALLFSGQGSQYPGMAREAGLHFEPVAQALALADAALSGPFAERFGAGTRLSQFVYPRGAYDEESKLAARKRLTSTDIAQPALGAVEVGLLGLMQSLGLQADMAAGHSYGEFVALFAAGAIDFDALMQLSAARGRFIVDAAADAGAELGTMAAVNAPRKVVEDAIADIDQVIIANHNAPLQSIISGTRDGVKAATARLAQVGVEVTEIPVAAAFHSNLVKPAQQALSDMIEATPWQPTRMPVYSNTTARPHAADVARVKKQMAEHLVRPVEFVAEIEAMHKDGARIFIEIGPKAVLARLTTRILEGQPHSAIAIDDGSGLAGLLAGVAQILCAGVNLDLARLFARRDCRIGDPAEPAGLLRTQTIPKNAWLLNGSVARRAAEPVRQVGVTLEQANERAAEQASQAAAVAAASVAAAPVQAVTQAVAPVASLPARVAAEPGQSVQINQSWRRSRPMDERRPGPGMADSVMSQYFDTMRQFLETQERVMSSYLGEGGAARPVQRARPMAMPMALPRMSEAVPVAPVIAPPVAVTVPAPAPVAAPVPAPVAKAPEAAAPVKVAAPAPAPAPAPVAKAAEPAPAGETLSREKLVDMLLTIVEEKTGYPRDMVGLDQNLEADLGIDSIKRIEVVGAMLQLLPAAHREALTESRSKLNTQPTLNGMVDLIAQAKVGAVAVPFDLAGVGAKAERISHPPRLIMRPLPEPIASDAARSLAAGRFILTRDSLGVADALAGLLRARKAEVVLLAPELPGDETAIMQACRSSELAAPVAGFVHLAALGMPALAADAGPAQWRAALDANEKSLFLFVRELSTAFVEGAHVVAACGLGGLFGREGTAAPELSLVSGAVGALKSLREEREGLRVKAVDLDTRRTAAEMAADLLSEIELEGGRQEVGYPEGRRTIFRSVAETVSTDADREAALSNLVVLATGGARGITAEVLRELARPGNTLALTGRSALVAEEPVELAALPDADSLRKHFVAQVRGGVLKLTPGEIQRRVQQSLDQREMRANVADLRAGGATVEYHAVDVTDEAAISALVADLRQRHGRIDGVVHGAGVIEDKRLADKKSDSWSRVVDTKVIGLLLLQKHLDPATLKFFTVFSSVAGRYGNSGQSDYATANELMNRLCMSLQARWGERVAVSALCWGPWGATKFGAGMVTAETEAKFAEKGVYLVSAELGRRLFRQEITRRAGTGVEVVCGEAPWESREAELGAIHRAVAPEAPDLGALVGRSAVTSRPTGERIVPVRLDPARHLYLHEHALDGKLVLPAAAALEIMAEAARALWPGWRVVEVREHKLMKGIEVDPAGRDMQVFLSPPPYGSSEGFEVSAALQSDLGNGRAMTHYRCVVRLEHAIPAAMPAARGDHGDKALSVQKAYGEWLFHGPRFQVIEHIEGLSRAGSGARVRSTTPTAWLGASATDEPGWLFDPALLDAAAQMAWLWSRAYRDESALPTRFGRVVRYRDKLPQRMHMEYERIEVDDPTLIRGNVTFFDEQGEPVMAIEELDSVASAALNRLGGTARAAESASA